MAELLAASPEFVFDIAAGSVGGFCSKALDYPFDTAKVLLQTQPRNAKIKYNGTFHCLQESVKQKGFISLYEGIGSRLLGSMAENAVCFLAYAGIKRELLKHFPVDTKSSDEAERQKYLAISSLAGAGSGVFASIVMTPVELIKCRMQVSSQMATPLYKSSMDCVLKTYQEAGIAGGLFKGHMSTMYREVPGNLAWFAIYELACDALASQLETNRDDLPVRAHMAAGAAAGVAYWAAIYPVDSVKSVLQTQMHPPVAGDLTTLPTNFRQALSSIYQEQGLRGLYRGFGVTALRAAPANAVLFAGYEQTQQFLKSL